MFEDWFPFAIPQVAEDGQPFQQWDGSTTAALPNSPWGLEGAGFTSPYSGGQVPSKSSATYVTVYGPNSLYCLKFTLDQLVEYAWRVRKLSLTLSFSGTPASVSSSGGTITLPPPWNTQTNQGGILDKGTEAGAAANEWQNCRARNSASYGVTDASGNPPTNVFSYNDGDGNYVGVPAVQLSANVANAAGNLSASGTAFFTAAPQPGNVICVAPGEFWVWPLVHFSASFGGSANSDSLGNAGQLNLATNPTGAIAGNSLDCLQITLALASDTLQGTQYGIASGFVVTYPHSSATAPSLNGWNLLMQAKEWFPYGGVWDAGSGSLTGA